MPLPAYRVRKGGDQRFRRMAKREMPRREPPRKIDLSLPVERVQQRRLDRLRVCRQIVERLAALAPKRAGDTLRWRVR
jgi:hypothetical protein